MTQQVHLLIDTHQSIGQEQAEFQGQHARGAWSVRMRTLRGGRSEGVRLVEIDNGTICIDVLPTRGMGIWRVRRGDKTLGWKPPIGEPVHPAFVPLMEPAGLGWLDGFNELLCRCGLESNGPPEFDDDGRLLRPLHGRISNTPAHRVELLVAEDSGRLTVRGIVDEGRFHFQALRLTASISTTIGSNEFSWDDEVTNIGGRDAIMQMLYHFNIGQPLLCPGARVVAPLGTAAPLSEIAAQEGIETWHIMPSPRPGSNEQVYVMDLASDAAGDTRVLVDGLADGEALAMRLNKRNLPAFTVWRNTPAEADGYVVGIEPGTNFPNPRTFERQQGRSVDLKPGEKWHAAVTIAWLTNPETIRDEQAWIAALQAKHQPNLMPAPRTGWSRHA
ncbi:MAG: aldose 1-epimerase family protein [Pirellulales bacterium]